MERERERVKKKEKGREKKLSEGKMNIPDLMFCQ